MNSGITKIIEIEIAQYYSRKIDEVIFVPVGYFPQFDGISASKQFTYEIKFEAKASETFNLCFEVTYKGKSSGLDQTAANVWVHVVPMDKERLCCYEFYVSTLREALKDFPKYRAGDGKNSEVKLLPLDIAEKLKINKFFITVDWKEYQPYWS